MTTDPSESAAEIESLLCRLGEIASANEALAALLPRLTHLLSQSAVLQRDFAAELLREKLASMRALAYGASHEINNPLANIAARAQSLLIEETDPNRRRSLATINAQAFRAYEMIADLMLFAKPPAPKRAPVDLAAIVDRVLGELADDAREQGTELRRGDNEVGPLVVCADEVQIGVAVRALCQNALEAVCRGGRVLVIAARDGQSAQIHVSDSGPGLTEESRRHLFDPFYSGREAGRGLGLGLCKVWQIMELHGGKTLVESRAGTGTTFTLVFPADSAATSSG